MMEKRLLEILKLHKGREKAITGKELARILSEPEDRKIRSTSRDLIASGVPIASSVSFPFGYYIAETMTEANVYMQQLRNRLIEDALRRRDFKRAVAKSFDGAGQIKMF